MLRYKLVSFLNEFLTDAYSLSLQNITISQEGEIEIAIQFLDSTTVKRIRKITSIILNHGIRITPVMTRSNEAGHNSQNITIRAPLSLFVDWIAFNKKWLK